MRRLFYGASVANAVRDVGEGELVTHLEEELQRTRDRLQTIMEEHDSSSQELKASNEELQSINEELHKVANCRKAVVGIGYEADEHQAGLQSGSTLSFLTRSE